MFIWIQENMNKFFLSLVLFSFHLYYYFLLILLFYCHGCFGGFFTQRVKVKFSGKSVIQ